MGVKRCTRCDELFDDTDIDHKERDICDFCYLILIAQQERQASSDKNQLKLF